MIFRLWSNLSISVYCTAFVSMASLQKKSHQGFKSTEKVINTLHVWVMSMMNTPEESYQKFLSTVLTKGQLNLSFHILPPLANVFFFCRGNYPYLNPNQSSHEWPFSGWWLTYPSEKYVFVSWDDDIPKIWKNKSHVPNHQPVLVLSPFEIHHETPASQSATAVPRYPALHCHWPFTYADHIEKKNAVSKKTRIFPNRLNGLLNFVTFSMSIYRCTIFATSFPIFSLTLWCQ